MRFEIEDWVIKVRNGRFKATHLNCDKEVAVVNIYGQDSPYVSDHDEDSYCACQCMLISPRLKEFEIITESLEEES